MKFLRVLLAALVVAGSAVTASAQERPGTLSITVYDTTGAAIAAASVTLTRPDGTVTEQLADEKFRVVFLLPGHVGQPHYDILKDEAARMNAAPRLIAARSAFRCVNIT